MSAALLFALTLPGLVVLLVVLAVVERTASAMGRRSPLTRRDQRSASASGIDVLAGVLEPERRHETLEREGEKTRRWEGSDADGSGKVGIDLDKGTFRYRS